MKHYIQPDGITCGPTSLKMALERYGVHDSVKSLSVLLDTNPHTGTTGDAMDGALRALNAKYERSIGDTKCGDKIWAAASAGHTVLCRTLAFGAKHWYVVYGVQGDDLLVADPLRGLQTFSVEKVVGELRPRDYEHFVLFGVG